MRGALLQYTTYMLSCQSNISKLREGRKVGSEAVLRGQQTVFPNAAPIKEYRSQSLIQGLRNSNDSGRHKTVTVRILSDGVRFATSLKACVEKEYNSIVILISMVTVSATSYFGTMCNIAKNAGKVNTEAYIHRAGETHLNFLHQKKENQAKYVTLFWKSRFG